MDDLVFGQPHLPGKARAGWLWSVIPHKVELRYVRDTDLHAQVVAAARTGFRVNPLFPPYDLAPARTARLVRTHLRHFGNYKTYYAPTLEDGNRR